MEDLNGKPDQEEFLLESLLAMLVVCNFCRNFKRIASLGIGQVTSIPAWFRDAILQKQDGKYLQ